MRVLENLAKFCAIVAGFILTGITLVQRQTNGY